MLEIARELAGRIDREPGMRAVLIRDGDYYIAHRERIRRARAAKADMFLSIHADALRDRDVAGASVYVLSERGATDGGCRTARLSPEVSPLPAPQEPSPRWRRSTASRRPI